ncbi:hypothetical protein B0J11DRAFT_443760 [Dendryphion nanum]|uniref:Uncharacterized protein n=1 Tax=Dendryphion nanum TaxID=256645 RepID=A0A9P9ICW3_9PLEO|nr:hypothetical protein B0J11DRAFT_443760 [Dendryphion nanum]
MRASRALSSGNDDPVASSPNSSTFSIRTLPTSVNDFSKTNSLQIATATQELVLILQHDEILQPLYMAAIQNDIIGPHRFVDNFRGLLKGYSSNLRDEAQDSLEFLAAQLVASKAKYLADSILEKFMEVTVVQIRSIHSSLQSPNKDNCLDEEEPESESESEMNLDEQSFEDLVDVREFFVNSNAFKTLRSQLQEFVFISQQNKDLHVDQSQANINGKALPGFAKMFMIKVHLVFEEIKKYILLQLGVLEPPCPPQKRRVRWKCKCGKSGFFDVIEHEPGGALDLGSRIEYATGRSPLPVSDSQNHVDLQMFIHGIRVWVQDAFRKWRRLSQTPTLPRHSTHPTTATSSEPPPVQQESLHIMTCVQKGRYGKIVFQDRIETIDNDRKLFLFLKEQLARRRGRLTSILSLRTMQGIFFIKFRLSLGGNVEIRPHEPCCTSGPCECIPPKSKVEPSPLAEYRCIPGPPVTYPPVLPDYLMHLFTSPSCINENETWVLNQLPRRICGKLSGKSHEPAEGWGIYYEEGWDRNKIVWIVAILFLLGSLIFGVLWSKFKMDVQGAFGISAWWISVCGILMALIAIRVEKV